jgi:hypothetical protein
MALLGEITLERLLEWRQVMAGQPNAGQARALIRSYSTGHATLEQVLTAIGEFERRTETRQRRHASQVWVSPNFPLVDGREYQDVEVWQPGQGSFVLPRVRFVSKTPRGAALFHVFSKQPGSDYSEKRGSFVEAS